MNPAAEPRRGRAKPARSRREAKVSLPPADARRLGRAFGGRTPDPKRNLFGPGSVTWRVNREAVTLLGGGAAILMQIAHPLVAAGVADHSGFRERPLARLRRTLELTLDIAFSDAEGALAAVRQIERVHERVRGVLGEAVGPFPAGTPYAAGRPDLLFWVHATLVDTALRVYQRLVGCLSAQDERRYYEESKATARLFGVPESRIPDSWADFQRYMRAMLEGPQLTVGGAARAVAASILRPPLPAGVRHVFQTSNFFTVGFLPAELRPRFGLAWSRRQEGALAAVAAGIRSTLPYWPAPARFYPRARQAGAHRG
jgi:uncharacterized protein (DUF2236 family)